jgi:hypothetical protein
MVVQLREADTSFLARFVAAAMLAGVAQDLTTLDLDLEGRREAAELIDPVIANLLPEDPVAIRSWWHVQSGQMLEFAAAQLRGDDVGVPLAIDLANSVAAMEFGRRLFEGLLPPNGSADGIPHAIRGAARDAAERVLSEGGLHQDVESLRRELERARLLHSEVLSVWDDTEADRLITEAM